MHISGEREYITPITKLFRGEKKYVIPNIGRNIFKNPTRKTVF